MGVVRNKFYEKNRKIVNKLKDYIRGAFSEIDEDRNLCRTVLQSIVGRFEVRSNVEEGHFGRLRD